jgi:tetratricopeptide (TPR) repeat protein
LLLAMLDHFEEAVPLARESNERQRELDGRLIGENRLAEIARMAGDHEAAARHLQTLCEWLEERDQLGLLRTYVSLLGRELCALGRFEEAETAALRGRELTDQTDPLSSHLWQQVQALVLADRGEHADAERLARDAVAGVEQTEGLTFQGDAWCDLAEVLHAAGRDEEAAAALADALERVRAEGQHPDGAAGACAASRHSSAVIAIPGREFLEEVGPGEVRKMPS